MSDIVTFSETIFSTKGKQGVLPGPDADGYHTVVLGGLNCYNSAGEYYVADRVIDIFRDSSVFMRRVKNGALFAEVGHPRRLPGMTMQDFYARIIDIDDKNICAHISEVSLDLKFGMKNPDLKCPEMIAIMGKVKPAGNQAETMRLSLENRKQNTAFSVRGITTNHERNGRLERELTRVVTFDHVVEPGIKPACKAYAPGLESYLQTNHQEILNQDLFRETVEHMLRSGGVATESSREFYQDLAASVKSQTKTTGFKAW